METKMKMGGVKFSMMWKVLLVALLPLLVLYAVAAVCVSYYLNEVYEKQTSNLLETTVSAVESAYDNAYEGEYELKDEVLYKGNEELSNRFEIVDTIKQESDVVVTLFYQDVRMVTSVKDGSGNRMTGTKADPTIFATVQKKGSYEGDAVIGGRDYSVYYRAVKNADGQFIGMFFAGYPKAEMESDIHAKVLRMMLYLGTVFVLCIAVVVPVTVSIIRALIHLDKGVVQIAKGDFTVDIEEKVLKRNDEIGLIGRSVENMKEEIREIVIDIHKIVDSTKLSANEVGVMSENASSTIDDISHAVEEIAIGATSQAEDTQSAANNVESMGKLIEDVVANVKTLTDTANDMGDAENDAMHILAKLDVTTTKTNDAVAKIASQTETTNRSAKEILQVVDLITSIAEQTNLLSLNASIEAARAGESGRGFAVVASEIQVLAEQCNTSAKKIQQIVSELVGESAKTVDFMQNVEEAIAQQEIELANTKQVFTRVRSGVGRSLEDISGIHSYTDRLDKERANIVEIIQDLSAVSQENAAATEETTASTQEMAAMMNELAASASELEKLSDHLEESVKIFKV